MLKKTVTYEDPFTNKEVTEDLYFNLTKAEIIEMEMGTDGGLKEHLEKIAKSENGQQIMDEMKGIILKSYGRRSENGKFIKNDMLREEFASSEAYSTLFVEMVTDADVAVEFVNGIMPKGLEELGQDQLPVQEPPVDRPNLTSVELPPLLTQEQLISMDREELRTGLATGKFRVA